MRNIGRLCWVGMTAMLVSSALLIPTAQAKGGGSGGGGGGGTPPPPSPPPPAGAPAVAFFPSSLTFPATAVGDTSAPLPIVITNTGTAGLFVNSAVTRGADPLDFTNVDDQCSGVTVAPGGACSMAINFHPIAADTRLATFILTDNAPASPQTVPISGLGTGTTPALAFDTQFSSCAAGVCDVAPQSSVKVNNFFSTGLLAKGGFDPYTFRLLSPAPAGMTFRPSGMLFGTPTGLGTALFDAQVTDSTGATATGRFSLTVVPLPAPTPPGCQTGPNAVEPLSGPALNGRTPSGQATADMSTFSGCGGYTTLNVRVSNVNLPDGTVLWVTLDFGAVGTITLHGGSGSMNRYILQIGLRRDAIRVSSSLPDLAGVQQILIGGIFTF